jgi:hypothetical protein
MVATLDGRSVVEPEERPDAAFLARVVDRLSHSRGGVAVDGDLHGRRTRSVFLKRSTAAASTPRVRSATSKPTISRTSVGGRGFELELDLTTGREGRLAACPSVR